MGIYSTKSQWQRALQPVVDFCVARRVHPNAFTYAAVVLSLMAALSLFLAGTNKNWLWIVPPFTIQPYHPQLEMAARALTSNTGKPWIMRLRSLDLYKQWLNEAGLEYVSHDMEKHQIFGVVQARKIRNQ